MYAMFILRIFHTIVRYFKIDLIFIECSTYIYLSIYIKSNKLDSVEHTFRIQLNKFKVNDVKQMLTPSTNRPIRS